MQMKRIVIAAITLVMALTAGAQNKSHVAVGRVEDQVTHKPVFSTKATLMRMDSTVVDSAVSCPPGTCESFGKEESFYRFFLNEPGTYLVKLEKEGYETLWHTVEVKFYRRSTDVEWPTLRMKRLPKQVDRQLGEAVVKASKVKFYYKGDTLVYNADAFQMASGSMLDELISQLPGVDLNDEGQIKVNGRFVDELLLNGKDFFSKDRTVMLENLPSYMVNQVKAYTKAGMKSVLAGRDMGDSTFVMDVVLKKQYQIGWVGNAEAGYGTKDRYLARLFALRFSDHSRLTLFGTMNNLNDNRKPGRNGDWSPDRLPQGLTATKTVGADYYFDDKDSRYQVTGNAKLDYSDGDSRTETSTQNYLKGGDTYGRQRSAMMSENLNFATNHELKLTHSGNYYWGHEMSLNYRNNRNWNGMTGGTFNENPDPLFAAGFMDSLRSPVAGELMRKLALNRTVQQAYANGHGLNLDYNTMFWKIKVGHTDDMYTIRVNAGYYNNVARNWNHYRLDYPVSAAATDFRNRYLTTPRNGYNYGVKGSYDFEFTGNGNTDLSYGYEQRYASDERHLYRLDRLERWGLGEAPALGRLPGEDSLLHCVDAPNTYTSRLTERTHSVSDNTQFQLLKRDRRTALDIRFNVPFHFKSRRLRYHRAALDTAFTRCNTVFDPRVQFQMQMGTSRTTSLWFVNLVLQKSTDLPLMSSLIDVADDSNPLYITRGNAHLRASYSYKVNGYVMLWNDPKGRSFRLDYSWTAVRNALSTRTLYDRLTGVVTTMPDNVNGNWQTNVSLDMGKPLDKKKQWTLNTVSEARYYNLVDQTDVVQDDAARCNKTRTLYLSEHLKLGGTLGRFTLGAHAKVLWMHATGTRADFNSINAWDYQYGLRASWKLPLNFQATTDLTMYSRRGYDDRSMNEDDLVWNARVSKRLMNGRVNLVLDAFDLLHQLSNVTATLNANGRVETWRNSLPHYLMFRLIYRLNKEPKKQ